MTETLGAQIPRIWCAPPAVSSAGAEAVELAAEAGLQLDPWQQFVLEHSLGEVDGKHAAFEVAAIVPRQNGKGALLEARELAGLFLLGERLILHSAHEFKTAEEGFFRILQLIENTPDFDAEVAAISRSHGSEGITLKSGQRLRFVARSRGSGRGFTGDCVILDEAYALDGRHMGALLPTLRARPNPQVWYTSSAGHLDSDTLRAVRARGIEGKSRRLAYFEWSVDDDQAVKPDDTIEGYGLERLLENARLSNPGIGIRISPESIPSEFEALEADEFNREILGIWEDPLNAGVFDARRWKTCEDAESSIDGAVTFAVEVAEDRSWSCIAGAGWAPYSIEYTEGDEEPAPGPIHVEVVDYRQGTAWVVDRIVELVERHVSAAVMVQANTQAGAFISELEKRGVYVIEASSLDFAKACGLLFDAVGGATIRHLGQAELNSAQRGAQKKNAGDGAFVWDRRTETAEISPLSAVTLAFWGFLEHGSADITDSIW